MPLFPSPGRPPSPPAALRLPPAAGLPGLRNWLRLARFGARAVAELMLARIVFARLTMATILQRNAAAQAAGNGDSEGDSPPETARDMEHEELLSWISYTMSRAARRLPFRADCLVQALAAQRWLARRGIPSRIVIGAELPEPGGFGAHAWLTCGTRIVTGGETGGGLGRYTPLV